MEKKYAPSKKRLDKARKEGNIPKSQYLSQSVGVMLGLLIALIYLSNSWVEHKILIEYIWTDGFKSPAEAVKIAASKYFFLSMKLLLIVSAVNIMVELVQVGFHIEPALLSLKLTKIDPVSGSMKLVDGVKRSWLVVLKFLIILIAIGWFFYGVLQNLDVMIFMPFESLGRVFYQHLMKLIMLAGTLLIALALLDYYVQRKKWFKSVGMSLQDMKQEHKEDEGDPHIKSARKHMHRELVQQDLIKRIRAAKVIIVERAA